MKVLLDTCTLAELGKPLPNSSVINAIEAIPDENLFLSVLTIGELSKGICLLDQGKRRTSLTVWLAALQEQYTDRILMIDLQTVKIWGDLTARSQKNGNVIPSIDGLIAATAVQHDMSIMTRNLSDFNASGVKLLNPWLPQS